MSTAVVMLFILNKYFLALAQATNVSGKIRDDL